MGPEVEFAFQHHARFVAKEGDKEIISIYDNSAHGTEDGRGHEVHFYKHSRGKIIEVNTKTWEATIVQVHIYTACITDKLTASGIPPTRWTSIKVSRINSTPSKRERHGQLGI